MGRSHRKSRNDSEHSVNQKLKFENQKLKKQISQLRKQLSRIDIDRYSHLRDIIEAQDNEDHDLEAELYMLKKEWECHKCKNDHLRVVIVPRADGVFYLRRCPSCNNKTKLKRYTDSVAGIGTDGKPIKAGV